MKQVAHVGWVLIYHTCVTCCAALRCLISSPNQPHLDHFSGAPPSSGEGGGSCKQALAPRQTCCTISRLGRIFCKQDSMSGLGGESSRRDSIVKKRETGAKKKHTHGKNDHDILLLFNHHGQIISHLEPPKRFVDEDVADLRRRDEPRGRG